MVRPSTHFAPAVEDCNFLYTIRSNALNVVIKSSEFITNRFDIFNEIGELKRKLKISAVSDTLNRAS